MNLRLFTWRKELTSEFLPKHTLVYYRRVISLNHLGGCQKHKRLHNVPECSVTGFTPATQLISRPLRMSYPIAFKYHDSFTNMPYWLQDSLFYSQSPRGKSLPGCLNLANRVTAMAEDAMVSLAGACRLDLISLWAESGAPVAFPHWGATKLCSVFKIV